MGKHQPAEKHPDGKGSKAGGGVCGSCGGARGKYVTQATVDHKGKAGKIDIWKPCPVC